MKKIHFYNSFSKSNLIFVACCLSVMLVCIYFIVMTTGSTAPFLLLNSLATLTLLIKVFYQQRHDYIVFYSPWKITFKLKATNKTLLLKNLRDVTLKKDCIEINLKGGQNLNINLSDFNANDTGDILALLQSGRPANSYYGK